MTATAASRYQVGSSSLVNRTTSQDLLDDPDRLVSFGVLDEESRDARKLVTTVNLRKYGFISNKASLEPLEETIPPKESEQPRRAPFVFPRSRRERAAEAARPIPAQLVRTAAPSQPPVHEATRAEQVVQAPPACPRHKAPAQRSKKRKQVQAEESETESEEEPLRSRRDSRRSGKEPASEAITSDKAKDIPVLDSLGSLPEYLQPIALLAMRMSMEKTRLGAAKGSSDLQEEVAKLKKSLESAEAERTQAFDAANRYLSQKDAALRTMDLQKSKLERRAEEVKELQRTTARLSKEVREKDQEIQTTSIWAQQAEQEMEASEQEKRALEAELQESRERIALLTEEMRNQSEELEEKAAD
ncbi:eukaryotic translation initiation factor 3 subunit A-like [Pistacia vera]|uniref:eukaryotic translation initiation factor 3 subunit A-like n=1 Tax=Pistacia vera TaxID=55513 RepID=UPI0012630500|nr:eukaryotic translation initiation factor 3 subunit A-like [Pistacia vera]